jgi:hypothetical protein
MKRILIISSVSVTAVALLLLLISFLAARASLRGDLVRNSVGKFIPYEKAVLSIEPNNRCPCWTFIRDSEAGALTVNVSLLGNPLSFGQTMSMEMMTEPNIGQVSSAAAPSASPDEPSM